MYTKLKDIMIEAAKRAGAELKEYFKTREFKVTQKSMNADLVTEVDKRAQDIIIKILSDKFPKIPIIAEEKKNIEADTAFYVDPLDGTLNFVHGFGMFAVSIGYWEDNIPKIGVVYNPISKELFWAIKGEGAYLNNKKIHVSDISSLRESMLITGWPYDRSYLPKVIKSVEKALNNAQEIRSFGSSALECCYVAEGTFDGYWEWGLSPWDLAAGIVILQEAGAIVTDIEGADFSLSKGDILCATPGLHKELLAMFKVGK